LRIAKVNLVTGTQDPAPVISTLKPMPDLIVHRARVQDRERSGLGDAADLKVASREGGPQRPDNHAATHLLQAAPQGGARRARETVRLPGEQRTISASTSPTTRP
ncbi:MAG: hypothetical protein MZV65_20685, partial [Chromatiales bacterium]|nr:hypothetical protein [Chromatiales bacterium]